MSGRVRRSIPIVIAAVATVALLIATGLTPAAAQPAGSGGGEPAPSPGPDADLALTMRGPSAEPLVGDRFDYVITVTNAGPSDASDVVVSDYLPEGVSFVSASSSDPTDTCARESEGPPPSEPQPADGSGSGSTSPFFPAAVNCDLGIVPNGATTTIRLTVTRTNAREIWNGASVSSSNDDPSFENNFDEVVIGADRSRPADVAVTKTAPASVAVGDTFDYVLTVRNLGPSRASDVTLRDFLPDGIDFNSASSSDAADTCTLFGPSSAPPQGQAPELYQPREVVCELGALAEGDRTTVRLNVTRTSGYEIWNSAWASISNYDPNFDNDYGDAVLAADPSVTSDLAMTLSGPATTPLVGDRFDLVALVSNAGPADAPDAILANYVPDGLRFESASSSDATDSCTEDSFEDQPRPLADEAASSSAPFGGGVTCTLGTLASGESSTITFTFTRTNARETWGSGSVWSSNHDPNFENNYDDVVIEPDRSNPADVAVAMTAPDNPVVGTNFEYVITVTNEGPSPAADAVVTDFLPDGVDFVAVSSSDPNDSCALVEQPAESQPQGAPEYYRSSEVRCALGTLAVGEAATIRIEVTRTSEYEIWNAAWTSITNYDPNFENDFAEAYVVGKRPPGYCPAGQVEPSRDAPTAGQSKPVEGCDSSTTVCGTEGADEIVIDDCAVESGGGGDRIEVSPTRDSARDIKVSSGVGADTIVIDVASDSPTTRRIVIDAGSGRDHVTLRLAPGVGNVNVLIRTGSGNDRIDIDISAPAAGIEVVARGGGDDDRIRSFASLDPGAGERPPGVALAGGRGRDGILGGMGDDAVGGGRGRDVLAGGPGDDAIRGGPGSDRCFGGPGRDSLHSC